VSFIKSRLRRVAQHTRGGSCAECGLPPDEPGRIVYDRIPEGAEEFCPRCGRRLWFVIEVVGADQGGGGLS
jgi:ribosomal protein L37E